MFVTASFVGVTTLVCAIFFALVRPLAIYVWDSKDLRRFPSASAWGIPGWAGWSNFWLARAIAKQAKSQSVLDAHEKYGPIVRIQPDHLSFSDGEAAKTIYGFQSRMPKGSFYESIGDEDAHGRIQKNLVTTDDREEHQRKRKYVSNAFALKNILAMEPVITRRLGVLIKCLDNQREALQADNGQLDLYRWINYFLYDTSAELTFGETLGLCDKGNDALETLPFDGSPGSRVEGIETFQSAGSYVAMFSPWPSLAQKLRKLTSWHRDASKGKKFAEAVHGYLQQRLKRGDTPEFRDFVSYLLQDSYQKPRDLEYAELLGETFVIFGSAIDLVATVATNAMYHLIKNPECMRKLRDELDGALGDTLVPTNDQICRLPYLRAAFDEATRDRPPIAHGLARTVPEGGATISGHFIKAGTTVSVSAFALHHNASIFPEPSAFRPERWLDPNADPLWKECLVPFSLGPRACTGRNLTFTLIPLLMATLVRRYDFELPSPDWEMEWREPLNMNPTSLPVKMKIRDFKTKEVKGNDS
ncbi:hypothetical protein B0A52_01626 [Exophiala mesophila]|uniref:Benzoate 4-monooxygenase n=1 Tax=Exophiala mesophila TaxID=212818 RepID=A0A438NFJ6_EXOME|nr:hypothetical protein B0A52_01626 [Exophiala mesophila]